jgi:hypothetical protein
MKGAVVIQMVSRPQGLLFPWGFILEKYLRFRLD